MSVFILKSYQSFSLQNQSDASFTADALSGEGQKQFREPVPTGKYSPFAHVGEQGFPQGRRTPVLLRAS